LSVEVLKRKFLFPEGLGSFETVVDDPRTMGLEPQVLANHVTKGEVTLGAFMVLLGEGNRMVLTVTGDKDLDALREMGEGIAELVGKMEELIKDIEARAAADTPESNVVQFPTPSTDEDEVG